MNFPLHWITLLHLRPQEPINFIQKVVVILAHSSSRKPHKSSIFWRFHYWAFSFMIFHTFSIGFISGLCGGHFISAIPLSSRKLNRVLALCQGTLSCINIRAPTVSLRKWGRASWWRSSLQRLTLILLWKWTVGSTPAEEIIPHTITLSPPNFKVFLTHWGDKRSPFYVLQTYTIRCKHVEFRLITKVNHIPLFLRPLNILCSKAKTNLLIFLWNQRVATWNPSHWFFLI